jgi:UDP-N-acetylglucosamine 2-epimerase (non-hydrolysing)
MIKLLTVLGTRPEVIKMSIVISEFDKYFINKIVHTGQNYDYHLNKIFFNDLNIRKPDYFLNSKSKTSIEVISKIYTGIEKIILKEKPEAFVIYGDTNSCLSAYVAKRYKIPIFHFESGNRCFDQNVPEEINRRIIDQISDVNFVISENARQYLIKEGINQNYIIKTGSHLKEVINFYDEKILSSEITKKLKIKNKNYFVASIHREENLENHKNFTGILNSLNAIAQKYKKKIIFTTHPRTKKKLNKLNLKAHKNIIFTKPLAFTDYANLQKNSLCVLSDSGTLTEESYLLNFPAISLRSSNERPEGFDSGVLIMSGTSKSRILDSLKIVIKNHNYNSSKNILDDYEVNHISRIAINTIVSYIDYVKKNVWNRDISS